MKPNHQKHPPIPRPHLDHYAKTDIALVGSTCATMDGLITSLAPILQPGFRTLTVIGDHGNPVAQLNQQHDKRYESPSGHWNDYDERLQSVDYDLALINGNHYPAARQIVFIDPAKASTLERRRDQLTDIIAVVHCPGGETLPDWLAEDLKQHATPVFCQLKDAMNALLPVILNLLSERIPTLKTLILVGGKSQRMGARKADLIYRNQQTEAERLADIANQITPEQTYFSVADKTAKIPTGYPAIQDRFLDLGPAGAIASAFLSDPDAAWLVLACDLPLLEGDLIDELVRERNPAKAATAFRRPGQRFPEPLVAIYEPRAYQRLLRMLSLGYACPRKLLINSDTRVIDATDDAPFTNANTPEERQAVLSILAGR